MNDPIAVAFEGDAKLIRLFSPQAATTAGRSRCCRTEAILLRFARLSVAPPERSHEADDAPPLLTACYALVGRRSGAQRPPTAACSSRRRRWSPVREPSARASSAG